MKTKRIQIEKKGIIETYLCVYNYLCVSSKYYCPNLLISWPFHPFLYPSPSLPPFPLSYFLLPSFSYMYKCLFLHINVLFPNPYVLHVAYSTFHPLPCVAFLSKLFSRSCVAGERSEWRLVILLSNVCRMHSNFANPSLYCKLSRGISICFSCSILILTSKRLLFIVFY